MLETITRRAFLKLLGFSAIVPWVSSEVGGAIEKDLETVVDPNGITGIESIETGPTLSLGYSEKNSKENPIASFMYFIQLISPTLIETETSAKNKQRAGIISYKLTEEDESFTLKCEFKIHGEGFFNNKYDPKEMIEFSKDDFKKGKPLENMLEYIKIEGEGIGRIEVKGTKKGNNATVNAVDIHFNTWGKKSPVTIGLYDVKLKDWQYSEESYKARYNNKFARVNTLMFKRSENIPRMDINVASVYGDGFLSKRFGWIAGKYANWFLIKPFRVNKLGNDAMLDFGHALYEKRSEYTFPMAKNSKKK